MRNFGEPGERGKPYLSNEDEHDEAETEPRAPDAEDGLEGQLVEGVAVVSPSVAEANVREADAAPGEESSETGQRLEPVEGDGTAGGQGHVGQWGPGDDCEGRPQRAAGAVDVCEKLGRVALLGERGERAGATVHTRETDGDDREHDDDVGEVGKTDDAGALGDDDEGRGGHVDVTATKEALVVVGDEKTDEGQGEDVKEGDTPEHLLDGGRERPGGVLGLGGGETDKLSTGEGEGGSDEDTAESNEGGERAGVLPCLSTLVRGEPAIDVSFCGIRGNVEVGAYSPSEGPPPQTKITPMNRKTMIVVSFSRDTQNSSSAYPRTPKTEIKMMTSMKMVIQTARCTPDAPSHHWTVKPATTSSSGNTIA